MSPRSRRLAALGAAFVALLFAGRWTAVLLADRWWAARVLPGAEGFLTGLHLFRLGLELGGALIASAWFVGHFWVVTRAIGSVQISRNVANLEFRERITPRALILAAVVLGVVLGAIAGTGLSRWWPTIAVAWQGLALGVREPLLGHDAGLYLTLLPLWRALHGFAFKLVLLAVAAVLALYVLVGAARLIERRPAINDHARAHIGGLLAALALTLAWGYGLEPYELVAGIGGAPDASRFRVVSVVSPALTGTALMAAVLSAVWAFRPRHLLPAAGWVILAFASLVGHRVVPPLVRGEGSAVDSSAVRRLTATAFALTGVETVPLRPPRDTAPALSLWSADVVAEAAALDSSRLLAVDPTVIVARGRPVPVWLVTRGLPGGESVVRAVADDRVAATGAPLFYRHGDTLAYPTAHPYLQLSAHAVRPFAPAVEVSPHARGVPAGGWLKRLLLAWALQSGPVLGALPETPVAWHLSPAARLARLAPFAEWGAPELRIVDGAAAWVADGYLEAPHFPLVEPVQLDGRTTTAMLHAAFVGVVAAESGATQIYLHPDAGPLGESWRAIAPAVVQPAGALPPDVAGTLSYPDRLFRAQARLLERPDWRVGALLGRGDGLRAEPAPPGIALAGGRHLRVAAYERWRDGLLSAVLSGVVIDGRPRLELARADSVDAVPSPDVAQRRWHRFPTLLQLRDSVSAAAGRLVSGPLRVLVPDEGPGSYEMLYRRRADGRPAVAWVSLAYGRRLGAGRSAAEAWSNLHGATVPVLGVSDGGELGEARRWVRLADSALRRGDLETFGRAFDALKDVLDAAADSPPR